MTYYDILIYSFLVLETWIDPLSQKMIYRRTPQYVILLKTLEPPSEFLLLTNLGMFIFRPQSIRALRLLLDTITLLSIIDIRIRIQTLRPLQMNIEQLLSNGSIGFAWMRQVMVIFLVLGMSVGGRASLEMYEIEFFSDCVMFFGVWFWFLWRLHH
jgi:hypothetical protein